MTRRESKQAMLDELGAVPVVADALDPDQVAKAKRELGWRPAHSSWRQGFTAA